MSRRLRRKKDEGSGGAPGWMTTFSDLMSLLLTFFILLYSMSNVDAAKFKTMTQALQGVLSGFGYTNIIEGPNKENEIPSNVDPPDGTVDEGSLMGTVLEVYNSILDYVDEQGLDASVSVSMNRRGVYVDIKEAILFESGRADIKSDGIRVLEKLHGIFHDFSNEIVVEGHTDNVPMSSRMFASNWELSTGRAVSVLRYLVEKGGIDPKRISATGYGEYQPIVPNNTSENRANNRRVNILIIFDDESNGVDINGIHSKKR